MDTSLVWPWVVAWGAAVMLPLTLEGHCSRRFGQIGLVIGGLGLLTFQSASPPAWRLLCASLLFLYLMKGVVLLATPRETSRRTQWAPYLLFFTAWPGMSVHGLQVQRSAESKDVQSFGRGLTFLGLGIGIVLLDAVFVGRLAPVAAAWICIAGLLLAVHFGLSEVLTSLVRLSGRPVSPLFVRPELSQTLEDFWGRRWNLPFVDMGRQLFARPLVRKLGSTGGMIGMFLVSGLLHEMAVSYPTGSGWGLPSVYFLFQAVGCYVQKKFRVPNRAWTWAFVLLPLPVLFHPAFLTALPLELVRWIHNELAVHSWHWYLDGLLWVLAVSQLLVLAASRQVPSKLNWDVELPRLSDFNRKLMWTYGLFVVFTIFGFSAMTFALHDELLRGDRAATIVALFAGVYWLLRLGFDALYFDHKDWPKGPEFLVGHALLNSLFVFLVIGYGTIVGTNLLKS